MEGDYEQRAPDGGSNYSWRGKLKKPLSEESAKLTSLLKSSGGYVVFPKVFTKLMTTDEALVLAYLWDLCKLLEIQGELRKGWFFCTSGRMENELGMKRDKQDRILKSLVQRKFIKMERRGTNGKRHFLVRRKVIAKAVQDHFASLATS